jgi:hypothetical protein
VREIPSNTDHSLIGKGISGISVKVLKSGKTWCYQENTRFPMQSVCTDSSFEGGSSHRLLGMSPSERSHSFQRDIPLHPLKV